MSTQTSLPKVQRVLRQLQWMQQQQIWPNGMRYLWTDAFGVVLLLSLRNELQDDQYLQQAEQVVTDVERVLGRPRGIRIGEAPDRDGQYYHYLAMWLFALYRLGQIIPQYHQRAIELVKQIHPRFVVPDVGVVWKMQEDLRGPYPGYGFGAIDAYHGYVVYRLLDPQQLKHEIADMDRLIGNSYPALQVTQDLGLGMILWLSHFFPAEPWATTMRSRSLAMLDEMWIDPPGYFCREPDMPMMKFAFTNHGVSIGLQAVDATPQRVDRLQRFFAGYQSGDHYDRDAITHVMECCSWHPGLLLRDKIEASTDPGQRTQ